LKLSHLKYKLYDKILLIITVSR